MSVSVNITPLRQVVFDNESNIRAMNESVVRKSCISGLATATPPITRSFSTLTQPAHVKDADDRVKRVLFSEKEVSPERTAGLTVEELSKKLEVISQELKKQSIFSKISQLFYSIFVQIRSLIPTKVRHNKGVLAVAENIGHCFKFIEFLLTPLELGAHRVSVIRKSTKLDKLKRKLTQAVEDLNKKVLDEVAESKTCPRSFSLEFKRIEIDYNSYKVQEGEFHVEQRKYIIESISDLIASSSLIWSLSPVKIVGDVFVLLQKLTWITEIFDLSLSFLAYRQTSGHSKLFNSRREKFIKKQLSQSDVDFDKRSPESKLHHYFFELIDKKQQLEGTFIGFKNIQTHFSLGVTALSVGLTASLMMGGLFFPIGSAATIISVLAVLSLVTSFALWLTLKCLYSHYKPSRSFISSCKISYAQLRHEIAFYWLQEFRKKHPEIIVFLADGSSSQGESGVVEGITDELLEEFKLQQDELIKRSENLEALLVEKKERDWKDFKSYASLDFLEQTEGEKKSPLHVIKEELRVLMNGGRSGLVDLFQLMSQDLGIDVNDFIDSFDRDPEKALNTLEDDLMKLLTLDDTAFMSFLKFQEAGSEWESAEGA